MTDHTIPADKVRQPLTGCRGMKDPIHRAEIYALDRDILCDHLIDYLDCGDCRIPAHIVEAANGQPK